MPQHSRLTRSTSASQEAPTEVVGAGFAAHGIHARNAPSDSLSAKSSGKSRTWSPRAFGSPRAFVWPPSLDKTPRTAISAFNPLPCSKKGTMILSVTTRLSTFFVPSDNAAHELSTTNMFKSFTYTVTSADVKCGPFPVIWQP